MSTDDLLELLRELEVSMHQPEVCSDPVRLDGLLHESFFEVGRSGRSFTRSEILEDLMSEQRPAAVWSQDFVVESISEDIALLRYKTAHIESDGMMSRYTLRTSMWQHVQGEWKIRFHQGTPAEAFARGTT